MRCPLCQHDADRVLDSRPTPQGDATRRRRECERCNHRFTTYERVELQLPLVVKKDGQRQPFSRDKLLAGIFKAVHRRPVTAEAVHDWVRGVEVNLAERGEREVESGQLGDLVMGFLRSTDLIAYVRFASVYKEFNNIDELLDEVKPLAAEARQRRANPPRD
ncbi:MAG: transcriptional repressor NrdR [Deltaproteobacteria bacterium]|nr:transcriptional repressor NrdR [Deltaproteobacteria bacterium]